MMNQKTTSIESSKRYAKNIFINWNSSKSTQVSKIFPIWLINEFVLIEN